MEFVFAVEDRFDVRIPEERLDPRQAGVTLEQLALLLDEAVAREGGQRCRQRLARRRRAGRRHRQRRRQPDRHRPRRLRRRPLRRPLRRSARTIPRPAGHRAAGGAVAAADFDAAAVIAPSRVPLDRATAMALAAADEAARRAGLGAGSVDPERLGIFWGSGMAGASTFETTCRIVYAERRRMRPTSVVTTMPNAPTAELALRFGAPRRRPRLRLRLRLVGGGDRRGDAGDPRRLDRHRHRRRQRVAADAGRRRELAGDARARAADVGDDAAEAARAHAVRSPPIAPASRSARRRRLRSRIARARARARRGADVAAGRLCDQLRRRPHHQSRRRRAGARDARRARRRRPRAAMRSATSTRTARRRLARRRRRGGVDRVASSVPAACR